MATFLDLGLLDSFNVVFTVLFIFTLIYALLESSKFLTDSKGIHAIIAIALAFLSLASKGMIQIITTLSPIFVVIFIFILLLLMVYKIFGMEDSWIKNVIQDENDATLRYFLLIVLLVIFVSVIASVYSGELLSYTSSNTTGTSAVTTNIGATIFHPKVLGLIFVMLIGVFTIQFMTKK